MKKNLKVINAFRNNFPTLFKLTATATETALELKAKKKVFAFINNAFSFGVVGSKLPELVAESIEYQGENMVQNKEDLKAAMHEQFKGEDSGLIEIIFEHVVPLIYMNIGGGAALEKAIRDYEESDKSV